MKKFILMALKMIPYLFNGDLDWIRTSDLLLRRQLLYPAELPDQFIKLPN